VIKNIKTFESRTEVGTDNGVKIGIQVLKNGDGSFVGRVGFVNESAPCDFKGRGKGTSGKDEGNKVRHKVGPVRM
jgi:hypothetical protein